MRTLYIHPVVSSVFFFFSSSNLSRRRLDYVPYFHSWCGLSANLECMSEMCCTYRQSEKNVKQQYLIQMSHNILNFGPLAAEIVSLVWGTAADFNVFRVLAALLHGTPVFERQPSFAALNRGRHLYSSRRPSRWALAHILVTIKRFQAPIEYWTNRQDTRSSTRIKRSSQGVVHLLNSTLSAGQADKI